MKPYKDPDEFIKNLGKEAFQERIDNAENSFFFEIRILEEQFDQSDPEQKTKFHREIAAKLCEFSEDAERENYLQAVCGKYNINFENMRKLVLSYASRTGLAKPVERPRSGVQKKNNPEENAKRSQRILITWITDNPALYPKIKSYVSSKDFTDELYRKVVDRLFADLDAGNYNPAAVISMFEDEDEQRQAAELFNTNIPKVDTKQDMEKALHDILMSVKTNSYEYYAANLGADVNAITQVIEGKKALEELAKTHISID
jgi:DNA primase